MAGTSIVEGAALIMLYLPSEHVQLPEGAGSTASQFFLLHKWPLCTIRAHVQELLPVGLWIAVVVVFGCGVVLLCACKGHPASSAGKNLTVLRVPGNNIACMLVTSSDIVQLYQCDNAVHYMCNGLFAVNFLLR